MTLEKNFQLTLPEPPERLLQPEYVFGGKSPFGRLERQEERLMGELVADVPLLGEIHFPFSSRIEKTPEGRAVLHPGKPNLGADPRFWAELWGAGQIVPEGILYELGLRVHAALPEGEKWGGRALRRMAEAAFERTLNQALGGLSGQKLSPG